MTRLEFSTRFSGVSTSPRSKAFRLPGEAMRLARSYLAYICRPGAAAVPVSSGLDVQDLPAARRALLDRAQARTRRGGSVGCRVFERAMVSLPNDFSHEQAAEAMRRFLASVVPADSDACGFAVLHTDKPGNLHAHLFFVDGLEGEPHADARKRSRSRRRDALRFGDRGAPKRLRALAADAINSVAREHGLSCVEHRSFAARGLSVKPTTHDGPVRRRLGYATRSTALGLFHSLLRASDEFVPTDGPKVWVGSPLGIVR